MKVDNMAIVEDMWSMFMFVNFNKNPKVVCGFKKKNRTK
jgi:hypothetical protein